jgi:ZIP family zinc transporter
VRGRRLAGAEACRWGFIAGAAAIIGALIGYYRTPERHFVGIVTGFGVGVLVSVLAIDLMEEAYHIGGLHPVTWGFLGGAVAFVVGDHLVDNIGGKHRKCSIGRQADCTGIGLWVGAVLDGIPESVAVGVSLLAGRGVSMAVVGAVFLSNLPEGLSGSVGMKKAGLPKWQILGMWSAVAVLTAVSSLIGYALLRGVAPQVMAATLAVAAGAILAMLADTMMPEAFHLGGNVVALATTLGFLTAFFVSKLL